jgi:hypothetical protein
MDLTDNTSTDSAQIFSALQKNLDHFGDPPSCEAGSFCVYPIIKPCKSIQSMFPKSRDRLSVFHLYLCHDRIAIGEKKDWLTHVTISLFDLFWKN